MPEFNEFCELTNRDVVHSTIRKFVKFVEFGHRFFKWSPQY